MTRAATSARALVIALVATLVLGACGRGRAEPAAPRPTVPTNAPTTVATAAPAAPGARPPTTRAPAAPLLVPAPLTPGVDLRAGPVPVPLTLQIPSIGVNITVVGVGITSKNVMDAPMGRPDSPVWRQAFWYRGSAVPGALSTALLAGHIDDPYGRPGAFAHIDRLRVGDVVIVHDTRNGLDVRFAVTGSKSYPLAEANDPAVLARLYGAGPVAGTWPQPSSDGLAHLVMVTCAGTFRRSLGTHDERLAVFATRVG